MISIGQRVEFFDQLAVLFDRGPDHEDIHAARQAGPHHFPPFRLVAGAAGFRGAVGRQIISPVALLEHVLDMRGSDDWTVVRVLHSIEIDVEGHDIPFEGLIFSQVDVIADHRT